MGSHAVLSRDTILTGGVSSLHSVGVGPLPIPRSRQFPRVIATILSTLPVGTWALIDVVLLVVGISVGYAQFVSGRYAPYSHLPLWQCGAILISTFVFSSLVFGLYEREALVSRSRILMRIMLTTLTAVALTYAITYVLLYTTLSRRVAGSAFGMFMVCGGGARLVAYWAMHRVRRNLVLVGPGIISSSLVRAFKDGFLGEYRLIGYSDDNTETPAAVDEIKYLGSPAELQEICQKHAIDEIVVGAEAAADGYIMYAVLPCLRRGCRVTNEATFYEKATGQVLVDEINPHWFLFADLQVHCQRRQALKRAIDIVLSALAMLAALPLVPLIAILIKLDGGPVFYTQTRVGQNGQPFRLFKFRTMRVGAETDKPVWAAQNDPRVTRVGRLLRRTRIDELPQLYNVLIGQMSLVGPRPERPDFVVKLSENIPYYNERHLVKPGITGWAQIGFRYGSSIDDAKRKLQFDLYYLKNMSVELDIMILLRTLGVFVRGAC